MIQAFYKPCLMSEETETAAPEDVEAAAPSEAPASEAAAPEAAAPEAAPDAAAAPAVADDSWVYLDNDEKQQGPFTTEQMKGWYAAGYLQPDRQVKKGASPDYMPLSSCAELQPAAVRRSSSKVAKI